MYCSRTKTLLIQGRSLEIARGVGRGEWHQKPNLLEKIFMLEFLVGWERGFETPKEVSIGTVW